MWLDAKYEAENLWSSLYWTDLRKEEYFHMSEIIQGKKGKMLW